MESDQVKKAEESKTRGLVDIVFSWSFHDALNKNLYMGKVNKIPTTFFSVEEYKKSFMNPLIEETHADLLSNIMKVNHAPLFEIVDINMSEGFKPPRDLFYDIVLRKIGRKNENEENDELQMFDLIALTDIRPRYVADLNRPNWPYTIASVEGKSTTVNKVKIYEILSSKPIMLENLGKGGSKRVNLFSVHLTNLNTNIRIWKALNWRAANINIVRNLLQSDSTAGLSCSKCDVQEINSSISTKYGETIGSFKLDDSQEAAVVSCVATSRCFHHHSVKLLWGPPGTGKTKTVASLLFMLLRMKCRTLTCAPTNIAVVGVANRLMSLVREASVYGTYGLGDIVLFGNVVKMKIDDHKDLRDIFLTNRVLCYRIFLSPFTGWRSRVESIICLLEDPKKQYRMHLNGLDKEVAFLPPHKRLSDIWEKESDDDDSTGMGGELSESILTYEEFLNEKFSSVGKSLMACIENMYTHLPSSFISVEVAKKMIRVVELLQTIESLMRSGSPPFEGLDGFEDAGEMETRLLYGPVITCIELLKELRATVSVPNLKNKTQVRNFCLQNATLLFCTASSSIKLHSYAKPPMEMLVIDEAAQLKECESTIPLQLTGLRHAVLIGDEKQLPAMVQSKISAKADFGRSLYERLVHVGHKKHLLKVQYRMHPSISLFPNKQFYDNMILDGFNVKKKTHEKHLLEGKMFGTFSFINVPYGNEEFDNNHSLRNMAEVCVIAEIVARLFEESMLRKQRVSVGCISPYKAQVYAIQDKLGTKYRAGSNNSFSVSVSSVDGFQGSEADVIIISTVRSNANGTVGFLSNLQRANVALTRARHCLWILGNGSTLVNSGSVWKKLVIDAKSRACFYNVQEDKKLALALAGCLIEIGQLDSLVARSLLFPEGKWKVFLGEVFLKSMSTIKNEKVCSQVLSLLMRIANGLRMPREDQTISVMHVDVTLFQLSKNVARRILHLIWIVDVIKEDGNWVQVVKVLDVLPEYKIPELKQNLKILFEKYTTELKNRCNHRCIEGDAVLPMTWPMQSNVATKAESHSPDQSQSIASQVAGLRRGNETGKATQTMKKTQSYNQNTRKTKDKEVQWQKQFHICAASPFYSVSLLFLLVRYPH
ncbi:hypothetical protein DCAR_0934648 [Daucus carota subsp. sativus]|uniref:DNA2/NAM7 helicase-like C-terminal domain-containing protein n=1 Tax=Daucus carota subsp. sativus TaxID=79200 RepID=A0AAF1BIE5_DAUCS|nr:hypothetical protein DCAR_0934648 [Daucus carota subsp. sativus]